MRIALLDGYVDEPANFGVPPYIAPQVRYVAGAVAEAGADLSYATIDAYRGDVDVRRRVHGADLVVLYASALVPGKYLRGDPIRFDESKLVAKKTAGKILLGGACAVYGFSEGGGLLPANRDRLKPYLAGMATLDADAYVADWLAGRFASPSARGEAFETYGEDPPPSAFVESGGRLLVRTKDAQGRPVQRRRTAEEWERFARAGAAVVRDHPDFPHPLIAELETYTGCVRYVAEGGCKFCMEPREGKPLVRSPEDVAAEVRLLHDEGVRNFRLGGQTCFYCYGTKQLGVTDRPRPDPDAVESLLRAIHDAAPRLRVLHIDNANPAVIATHPEEARAITRLLVKYTTPGNVAAFGLESTDPRVARKNNLNATPEEVRAAVRILNEEGGARGPNGMPHVLAGLNFIAGLAGEEADSHDQDFAFLESLRDEGLGLRRINLRQILPMTGGQKPLDTRGHRRFLEFKRRVREEVDHVLLRRMLPAGTLLRDVWLEMRDGGITFGRQIGTYPLLVGIPYPLPLEAFTDVVVTDWGQRSVTGFHAPFPVNSADARMYQALPGIGEARAAQAVAGRPYPSVDAFLDRFDLPAEERSLLTPHLGLL